MKEFVNKRLLCLIIASINALLFCYGNDRRLIGDEPISSSERPTMWIGYTEGRNDLPDGQYVNWLTNRACIVRADGSERQLIGGELAKPNESWTQFAGWAPDGKEAIILSAWESAENAAWEREHKTFRMTEGWLMDAFLIELDSRRSTNVTAVDRVSNYNSISFTPDGQNLLMTSLIDGVSKPFVMDRDGKNKRDISGGGTGFTYGVNPSPNGQQIAYHENYQVYISNIDGGQKRHINTGHPFNFAPQWSPDGEWLLFLSGEHYDCHPHIVGKAGNNLHKLADRCGYRGVVERLKHPDFHSESSDIPVWSTDGKSIYYVAKVGDAMEIMRASLDGAVEQLTHSLTGIRHYHPQPSPDGKWILFGSDRSGIMQLYVARSDGSEVAAITAVKPGHAAMFGHWQPTASRK